MKKMLSGLTTALFTACTALMPLSEIPAAADESCEFAWFPLRTMAITQISFESYSHGNSPAST